jgi:hypothetical protein
MTATFIFFDNKHRHLMGRGLWFRFGRQEKNADASERDFRFPMELRFKVPQNGLFDCYFRALLRLTRQMLNARVQHLPECLKKLDA